MDHVQWTGDVRDYLCVAWTSFALTSQKRSFVDQQTAFNSNLAYVTTDNKVVMRGDNTTWLPSGVNRSR
jgi:hypothetical protein